MRLRTSRQTHAIGLFAACLACLTLSPSLASAGDWRSTNLQLLQGYGFSGGSEMSTLTVEHGQSFGPASIFFFMDTLHRPDTSYSLYGEFYGFLSLRAATGLPLELGPLRDISITAGLNAASDPADDPFKAWLHGVMFDFTVPGFELLQLNVNAYKQEEADGYGVQITPVWCIPFSLEPFRFKFRGWFDWTSSSAMPSKHWYLLAQPQFLVDVGHFFQTDDAVFVGLEYHHWENKYGVKGFRESVPQMMMMLNF